LLLNENMKIYRRMRTWLLVIALVVITSVTLVVVQNVVSSSQTDSDWKAGVQEQIAKDTLMMANPDMPKEHKVDLRESILVNQYRLDHDVPPTGKTLWGNILTAAKLLMVVTIFTVIASADSVAGEFSSGTIKLLLIRPASRAKVLLSKYISTFVFSLLLLLILFVTAFLVSGLLVGFHDVGTPYLYASEDGIVHEAHMVGHVLSTYGYQCIELILIITMAFMISTVFRSSSLAIGFSIGIMFVGKTVAEFITRYQWAKYYLFENTDLTVYLNGTPKIAGMTLSFSITVLIVYYVIFMAASWLVFVRRDIAS
jgi:ABC-2 type transport system permease protein